VLVSRGWAINQRQPVKGTYNLARLDECNKKLIQLICRDEEMVRWCLDHGAIVDETDETLLADVASYGSINTFKLIHEHGASISESTLHNAAWRARPEMVTFLIEEIGSDVNKVYNGRPEPMLLHHFPHGVKLLYRHLHSDTLMRIISDDLEILNLPSIN
jgi:hypothetical protein